MSRKIPQRKKLVLFGLAVVAVAAILHAYQLVLDTRIIEDAPHADRFPGRLHLLLLLAFLVMAVGLLIGTRVGLVCSLLGLICVLLGHVAWLNYSHAVLYDINQNGLFDRHPDLRPPSLFGFVGARWWDVVLLLLFVALLVWEIKTLVRRDEAIESAK
jgi:hypothetical protein